MTDQAARPTEVTVIMTTSVVSFVPSYVLNVGGEQGRSRSPIVLHLQNGSVEFQSSIATNRNLLNAIVNGGEGRLKTFDQTGRLLNTLTVTFAEQTQLRGAAMQAEQAARGFAADAQHSDFCLAL